MKSNPSDQHIRQQALHPLRSFIVQAPAGAGKTELLTQRFLILLSTVTQPESVLAITFTNKAAAEMRHRILAALQWAAESPQPTTEPDLSRWRCAQSALKQNQSRQWQLLQQPSRLRIMTIDSLCAHIARQMPVTAEFGTLPSVADDANLLYQQAAIKTLEGLTTKASWAPAIATLLRQLDNDYPRLLNLLAQMLAKRDQWLPQIMPLQNQPEQLLKTYLETSLTTIIEDVLQQTKQILTIFAQQIPLLNELPQLLRFAAKQLSPTSPHNKIKQADQCQQLPQAKYQDFVIWQALITLLTTKKGKYRIWRKASASAINAKLGFPAPSNTTNSTEKQLYQDQKQLLIQILTQLQQSPNAQQLLDSFTHTYFLPLPEYNTIDWSLIAALLEVLPIAAATLKVIFQQHRQVDFCEISLAALRALGHTTDATDLICKLDHQIQHLLVDEFQDTSLIQYNLLETLLSGWQPGDNRSIFLVGDPMQSIYRFRQAEVGFFHHVQTLGIADLKPKPLVLTHNFRSTPAVIDWVNQQCQQFFPRQPLATVGAIPYTPVVAANTSASLTSSQTKGAPQAVQWHFNYSNASQVKQMVMLIKNLQRQHQNCSIALLTRTRRHIIPLISALKTEQIPYQAVEIEPLATQPVISDLVNLTRALFHLSDRTAWLALLRAPWCGLSLTDLYTVAQQPTETILAAMLCLTESKATHDDSLSETPECLSDTGKQQLQRITPLLAHAVSQRGRLASRLLILGTWYGLGAPSYTAATFFPDVDRFLEIISDCEQSGDITDLAQLEQAVAKLYAQPATNNSSNTLQIMTIHKAKGLEFDVVILPYLEQSTAHDANELLLWWRQLTSSAIGTSTAEDFAPLLIAPLNNDSEENSIYAYLRYLEQEKAKYEQSRLLYVALTRARKQIHLVTNVASVIQTAAKKPKSNCFLNYFWSEVQPLLDPEATTEEITVQQPKPNANIRHLPYDWQHPWPLSPQVQIFSPSQIQTNTQPKLSNPPMRLLGILIHQLLAALPWAQLLSQYDLKTKKQSLFSPWQNYWEQQLTLQGMDPKKIPWANKLIYQALTNICSESRGRWILQPRDSAKNEFALNKMQQQQIKTFIIDRTFIEHNNRWIIDYKISDYLSQDSLAQKWQWLTQEKNLYRKQLEGYGKLFTMDQKQQPPITVKLLLYWPLHRLWLTWTLGTKDEETNLPKLVSTTVTEL